MREVWTAAVDAHVRFGVAVSGGPDSLALLLLAHGFNRDQFEAVTVDHRLRPESGEEAARVGAICARLGVRHTILPVEVASGNMHDAAREARYRAMGEWALGRGMYGILTAHHADDQAETVLMRLNRGSGPGGLCGIRAMQPFPSGVSAIRPLLQWRKAELEAIVAESGLDPVRDPSNEDPRFDRARIRAAIGEAGWLDAVAIARSAQYLQQADLALWTYATRDYERTVEYEGDAVVWRPDDIPRAARLICVMRALAEAGGDDFSMADAARLHDAVMAGGKGGTLGGVELRFRKGEWRFAPEPPRRNG
ncbi:tRNA(Ile)-lysidine synthase [Tsuneonella dongtanensis]|uniref:tRNA(Ile)-lysidine synthase n=1 Tax=Tsuneonella dongtanensis TaxID=692370 RepID=A0A1B2ABG3_9SPHN|nr:tRNA lysidine(34) synthetase TilS [Tsuneonella dongtanensis]ANY19500.1 tRNA(Ile)-lysidine synthase [Tsuneonella dongtanensis]